MKEKKIKVILYLAITANGLIATEDDNVDWTSEESWKNYLKVVKKIGNAIIGRRTYDVSPPEIFLKDCLYVVLTHRKPLRSKVANVVFTGKSPKEALGFLEKRGFKRALVAGGGKLNASFMKQGLVDEIYLDVEPVVLGKGIPLFAPKDFKTDLELLEVRKLSPRTIQLHYAVKNNADVEDGIWDLAEPKLIAKS